MAACHAWGPRCEVPNGVVWKGLPPEVSGAAMRPCVEEGVTKDGVLRRSPLYWGALSALVINGDDIAWLAGKFPEKGGLGARVGKVEVAIAR